MSTLLLTGKNRYGGSTRYSILLFFTIHYTIQYYYCFCIVLTRCSMDDSFFHGWTLSHEIRLLRKKIDTYSIIIIIINLLYISLLRTSLFYGQGFVIQCGLVSMLVLQRFSMFSFTNIRNRRQSHKDPNRRPHNSEANLILPMGYHRSYQYVYNVSTNLALWS